MTNTLSLDALNDRALLHQFGELVRKDREGQATLLRHIDVIDRRKLWAKLGHPSLFDLLVTRYQMSESTAGKRIGAARTARRFPVLFDMVAQGEIHLSGLHLVKAHLTPENQEQVLAQAKHKTMRQIEHLMACLAPQPDAPSRLRALPSRGSSPPSSVPATGAPRSTELAPSAPAPAPKRAPDPAPLAPGRYRLQVTLGEDAYSKLKQLQDLLAHQIPNGDPAAIVERALDTLLAQALERKAALTQAPRARKPKVTRRIRWIPAAIRREVWTRDGGRCTFVGEDGHRCNETRCLEFAHLEPWGKGGEHSTRNITLRCRAHNAFEADRDYGVGLMASKRQRTASTKCINVREPVARYVVHRPTKPRESAAATRPAVHRTWSCPALSDRFGDLLSCS